MTKSDPPSGSAAAVESAATLGIPTAASGVPHIHLTVAFIGNPNTGKSTLFNALAGLRVRVGNFPGCTVEKKVGRVRWEDQPLDLVDLPGTYSLSPRSPDEMVSVDVLLGRMSLESAPDAVVCIVDASNLERNLYLVSQVLDLGLPVVMALNMADIARERGTTIDVEELSRRLGIPVVSCEAHRGRGLDELRSAILQTARTAVVPRERVSFPEPFRQECEQLRVWLDEHGEADCPLYLRERLLLDTGGHVEARFRKRHPHDLVEVLSAARERLLEAGCRIPAVEARVRYQWAREILDGALTRSDSPPASMSDRIDRWLTHRVVGLLAFAAIMLTIFLAIYIGVKPVTDLFEAAQQFVADAVSSAIPPGALRSLLVDGVVGGVGGVLVFVPQIAMLFLFIAILEDCGYMARAAFLMDKLMTHVGLSGKSFVPLMSSFACAIPGIMATRVIENRRDRMVTILVAPLMSCSARLPVYMLLIWAFVPDIWVGSIFPLQVLTLAAAMSLGALVAIPVAWILKKTYFKGETPPFVMELPAYKWPSVRIVADRVYDRVKAFVLRAGTLIFATTVVVWGLGYFPADHTELHQIEAQIEADDQPDDELVARYNALSSHAIENSFLGVLGHAIEPAVRPLGWDWRIGVGVLASFPAREVIIATLGTIYSLGGEVAEDDPGLTAAIRASTWPDGTPVFNVPVAASLIVFFALCAQCAATLMVIRRETNSWGWAAFTFGYMTTLAYIGAFITYQLGRLWL